MASFDLGIHLKAGDSTTATGGDLLPGRSQTFLPHHWVRLAVGQSHSLQEVTVFGSVEQLRELAAELTRVVDLLEADRRPELSVADYLAREVGR